MNWHHSFVININLFLKGAYSRLTLRLKLYLGGYIDMHSIAERVGVTQSFVGCIQSMNINDEQYDMRQVDFFGQAELGLNVGKCEKQFFVDINKLHIGNWSGSGLFLAGRTIPNW